jgi:hypothetical protein
MWQIYDGRIVLIFRHMTISANPAVTICGSNQAKIGTSPGGLTALKTHHSGTEIAEANRQRADSLIGITIAPE